MAIANTAHGGTAGNTTAGTSRAVTITAVTGETIIVAVAVASNVTINTPTDNATGSTNTYVLLGTKGTTGKISIYGCLASKSNVTTVTCTFGSSRNSVAVATYTGVAALSTVNVNTATGTTSPEAVTVPNALLTGSFVVAAYNNTGTGTWGASVGSNLRNNLTAPGSTTPGVAIGDSLNTTVSLTNSSTSAWNTAAFEMLISVTVAATGSIATATAGTVSDTGNANVSATGASATATAGTVGAGRPGKVFVGTFVKSTNTSTPVSQSVTGVGFMPKCIIFYHAPATGGVTTTVDPPASAISGMAISFTSGPSNSNNLTTSNGTSISEDFDSKAILFGSLTTVQAAADLTSFDSDGFTLSWTTNNNNPSIIGFIAFGEADVTNAIVKQYATPNSISGAHAYTGIGFKPTVLFVLQSRRSTNGIDNSLASGSFGIGTASFQGHSSVNGSVNIAHCFQDTSNILSVYDGGTNLGLRAALSSLDNDGFTLNYGTNLLPSVQFSVLAISSPVVFAGSFNKSTGAAPVSQGVTGVGFAPQGVLAISDAFAASSSLQTDAQFSISTFTSTANNTFWNDVINGGTTSRMGYTPSKVCLFGSNLTTIAEAGVTSLDSDGFTLNWTTNDANADQIIYFAFGSSAAASVSVSVSASGSSATATAGSITDTGDANVSSSGSAATLTAGASSESGAANVTSSGSSITSTVGSTSESGSASVTATGNSLTSATHNTSESGAANLTATGNLATLTVGSVTDTGTANVAVTGISGTLTAGTVTVSTGTNVTVAATGSSLSSAAGTVAETGTANVTSTGSSLSATAGATTSTGTANVSASGSAASIVAGMVSPSADVNVPSSGSAITITAGTVTVITQLNANVAATGSVIAASVGGVTVTISQSVTVAAMGSIMRITLPVSATLPLFYSASADVELDVPNANLTLTVPYTVKRYRA